MEPQESVRAIVRNVIEVIKDVPESLQSIAFPKVFDFLAALEAVGAGEGGLSSDPSIGKPHRANMAESTIARIHKSRASNGPKHAAANALEKGFFDEPRTVADLDKHLEQDFATSHESKHLADALARLVRDGRLRRRKNETGKYEYQRASLSS